MWVRMRQGSELCDDRCGLLRVRMSLTCAGWSRRSRSGLACVLPSILAIALASSAAGLSACGGDDAVLPTEAGVGDGLARPDTALEATSPPSCLSASTVCVSGAVFECVQGQVGQQLISSCPEACSLGRCTTRACAAAEGSDAARGCLFYAVQMDNVDSDDPKNMMLLLTNASNVPARVEAEIRRPDAWEAVASDSVSPGGATRIELSWPARESGVTPAGAVRITSDNPVMAVQIVSDDADRMSTSSAGTVLLPAQALGTSHLALTFLERGSAAAAATPGSRGGAGVIAVVGTLDGTNVHLVPRCPALVSPGLVPVPALARYDAILNEGDVLQVFSSGGDLTGSEIVSDRPVAVLSGNIFTTYGNEPTGFDGGDMAVEQLPPTSNWAKTYVAARLQPQAGCDPFFGPRGSYWQILASEDDTVVMLSPSPGTAIDDLETGVAFRDPTPLRMKRGQSRLISTYPDPDLPGGSDTATGDFMVFATHPVLVAQWMDCEPSLSFAVDTRFGGGSLIVPLAPGFDHEILIVRRLGTAVQFDGRTVRDDWFRSAGGEFEVARISSDDIGPCIDMLDGCEHTVSGSDVGVSWRGMDIVCSYSVTAPPSNICVLPTSGCVP